jgi:hypothetical protein
MKFFYLIFVSFFLLGCENTRDRINRVNNEDHNICANNYNLSVDSSAYANCRHNLSNIRVREEQLNLQRSEALMEYGRYISKCGISGIYCK